MACEKDLLPRLKGVIDSMPEFWNKALVPMTIDLNTDEEVGG